MGIARGSTHGGEDIPYDSDTRLSLIHARHDTHRRKSRIDVACADGYVRIEELQLAGKKRMTTADLLRGFRLDDRFTCE